MQYIQVTRKLRIARPGLPDLVSERPSDEKGRYTDLESPTMVDIDATCAADVAGLLSIGAIAEAPKPKTRRSGGADGEG
jgi:hypothetical protein